MDLIKINMVNILFFKNNFIIGIVKLVTVVICVSFTGADRGMNNTEAAELSQLPESQIPDEKWTVIAIRDVAYFLRNHKFNEWDRRYYEIEPPIEMKGFYHGFPSPKLRPLHWKVYENCYKGFYKCIVYLHNIVKTSPLTRNGDILLSSNKYEINKYGTLHMEANNECKKAILNIERTGLPFDGPNEKFQWSTSASYYMCWYTMLGTPALSMLGDSCDNFANCLDTMHGNKNRDPRADDRLPFACAMYSFCPDACCPIKHVNTLSECYNHKSNPCYLENMEQAFHRQCRFHRDQNQNLEDIMTNKWNVSCHCKHAGFVWKSMFGMCVDTNECITNEHNCDNNTQDCINLPGTFRCVCKWGFSFHTTKGQCIKKDLVLSSNEGVETNYTGVVDNIKSVFRFIGF